MKAVFVYGTLKRGDSNHHCLVGQKFVATARTVPGYTLYQPADYPAMVPASGDVDGVSGEVWEVSDECLDRLDELEGIASRLYIRQPVKLAPPHADLPVETYIYLPPLDGCPHLGSTWRPGSSD